MAWDDVDNGLIRVVQGKTGAKLSVPLHPDPSEALSSWPHRAERILVTTFGKPFSSTGFGNFMADKIADAGLPDRCVTHGLRKAAARRLAEAGCTANEIAAITGHATLVEVSRYTKAADQVHLAQTAIDRLTARQSAQRVPTPVRGVGNLSKKPMKSIEICSIGATWQWSISARAEEPRQAAGHSDTKQGRSPRGRRNLHFYRTARDHVGSISARFIFPTDWMRWNRSRSALPEVLAAHPGPAKHNRYAAAAWSGTGA